MGLIKRDLLEEKGILFIEKVPVVAKRREVLAAGPTGVGHLGSENVGLAKSEAQKIIAQAAAQAEQISSDARTEGLAQGRDEATTQIEAALTTLNEAVKERKKIIRDAESEILRLALKVAEQIIRSEVSLHRDVCLNIVTEAIGRVSDREQIIVRVNRDDAEYLKRYKDRLAGMLDGVKSFSIIEDANIEAGGCIIETNLGFVDARIPTKIQSIEAALQKVTTDDNAN